VAALCALSAGIVTSASPSLSVSLLLAGNAGRPRALVAAALAAAEVRLLSGP
jgi:hypothetical protein